MLTLQAKLIIAAIVAALIGYSYYWTFDKGREIQKAESYQIQIQAVKDALAQNTAAGKRIRDAEMKDAAATAKKLQAQNLRLAKDLQGAKEALKNAPKDVQTAAATVIPPNVVSLLNGSGSN